MQKNEFEKQMQQKMDELKMHPSETVWQNVEARIKKEKRIRWPLVLFPVVIIGILYGGYVFLNRSGSTTQKKSGLTKNFSDTKLNNRNNSIEKTKTHFDSIKINQTLTKDKEPYILVATGGGHRDKKIKTLDELKNEKGTQLNKDFINPSSSTEKEYATPQNNFKNENLNIDNTYPGPDKTTAYNEVKSNTTILQNPLSSEAGVGLRTDTTEKNKTVIRTDNKDKRIKSKYLWNWGVSFSAGMSGTSNALFGGGQKSFIAADAFSSSGSQINNLANNFYLTPFIKSSGAVITGFSIEKNIMPKIIFTTGLNYKLFSTKIKAGADSASYSRSNSNVNTYHTFYHFMEVPIGIKVPIMSSKKTHLYGKIGFSISRLVRSTTLQSNNVSGLYYYDSSQINKTQIAFNTAIDVVLFSKRKGSFHVGPYVSYSISKINRNGYNPHHFTFIGLQTHYIFRKNNY
ncbi:MAG: hypothetical protein ABIN97_20460 [Ginsengibacter sp.]